MTDRTIDALVDSCRPLGMRDKHREIIDLLAPIPPEVLEQSSDLLYWYGLALLSETRFSEGVHIVSRLESNVLRQPDALNNGRLSVLRALESIFSANSQAALDYAREATSVLPECAHQERFRAWATREVLSGHFGKVEESHTAFRELLALRQELPFDQNWWFAFVVPNHADWLLKTGHMREAELLLRAQLEVSPPELHRIIQLRLASIALEQGNTHRAEQLLNQSGDIGHFGEVHSYWSLEAIIVSLQLIRQKHGNEAVLNLYYDAATSIQHRDSPAEMHGPRLLLADIWIEQGHGMLASLWLELYCENVEAWPRTFGHLIPTLIKANLAIAETRWSDALALLEMLEEEGEKRGHFGMLIQIYARKAYVFARLENDSEAIIAARQAIEAGQDGRYEMSYIVRGVDVRSFLVLSPCTVVAQQGALAGARGVLSEREMEILTLVREGLTNPEIADHLFISRNTVKNHLRNIYQRWGVSTRQEAVHTAEWLRLFRTEEEDSGAIRFA